MLHLALLALEFIGLFFAFPLLIYYRRVPNLPIPYLLVAATAVLFLLKHDPTFDSTQLFAWRNACAFLVPILLRDTICLAALGLAVRALAPELLFSFVKKSPGLWALVMLLYPLLSVYPQELLYRAWFFHRYAPLFGNGWGLFLASAISFGFVHIIFRNNLAIFLCILGGLLFSLTYHQSGSLLLTCLDHALFGNFLFTIGLGQFFYHRSRP
jgi:membrane protease YdiL (CAAX protease family)